MESPLEGRLRNTDLPYSKGLMPLYEAVVNSIQSIEELDSTVGKGLDNYNISVEIVRSSQIEMELAGGKQPVADISDFLIVDDGIGFTDDNLGSFKTLDSLHKVDKGCRGIGRLLWLKAFTQVQISSNFTNEGKILNRKFKFNIQEEISGPEEASEVDEPASTKVRLCGFKSKYANNAPKTLESIASGLLEHCLWYFVRAQGVPHIQIFDQHGSIDLFELFDEHMHSSSSATSFKIDDQEFELTHVKIRASRNKNHTLGYCAAGRLVKEETLKGKIPGLFAHIKDTDGEFTYMGYLTSPFLTERVSAQRTGFNIENEVEGLLRSVDISFADIRSKTIPLIEGFLEPSLQENKSASQSKIESFVSSVAPKYRPLLDHIPSENLFVDPKISDKDLDLVLHQEVFKVEQKLLEDGHDVMSPSEDETHADYLARVENYLQTVSALKQSDLANYVTHRKVVLDLLGVAIGKQPDEKYSKEDVIHELIAPMIKSSEDIEFRRQNLWLIDERLAFHNFLASDKPIKSYPTTSSDSAKEPDIASLRLFDNRILVGDGTDAHASLTVIELKRPMRDGFKAGESEEKDPILQSLAYLRSLRQGAKTKSGRSIPNADKIPGFIYVIADFTDSLVKCCKIHQLQITADGLSYFGYHKDADYNAYIQVISFDGLLASAKERNRAFFDTLGLPCK